MYETLLISQLIFFFISLLANSAIPPPAHVNLVTSLFLWACFQETGRLLLEDVKTGPKPKITISACFV